MTTNTIHPDMLAYLEKRGFSPDTIFDFGLYTVPSASHVLAIPHVDGERSFIKYRDAKANEEEGEPRWKWQKGLKESEVPFWNVGVLDLPEVQEGRVDVVICEAALDALSVIEAGYPYAMAIPHGGREKPEDENEPIDFDNDRKFGFVWKLADKLKRVRRFIVWMDKDTAGHHTARALVRRLREERCKMPGDIPAKCKDANDVLRKHGKQEVLNVVLGARDYPIKGLFRLTDFEEEPELKGMPMFHPALTRLMQIVMRTLVVMTGYPSHGKSTLLYNIIAHMIEDRERGGLGLTVTVGSFETRIKPVFMSGLRAALLGTDRTGGMSHAERKRVDELMNERILVIKDRAREGFDVDRVLELAEMAVARDGSRVLILDPWNEIDHRKMPGENETDYAGRAIKNVKAFADDFDCQAWIVAHPAKATADAKTRGGRATVQLPRPDLYSISGSAHYNNKADYGLSIYRPDMNRNDVEVWNLKKRDGLPGNFGRVDLTYRQTHSNFMLTTDVEPATQPTPEQRELADAGIYDDYQ